MLEVDLDPKKFCPAHDFCTTICEKVRAGSVCLSLTETAEIALYTLLAAKGEGAYTRLVLSNGVSQEEVVLQLTAGVIRLTDTIDQTYFTGSSLTYRTTQCAINDMVACAVDPTEPSAEDLVPKIPGFEFTEFDEQGAPCYETTLDCEFTSGEGKKIKVVAGKITCCEDTCDTESANTDEKCPPDGVYCGITSLEVRDGKVISICAHQFDAQSTDKASIDPSASGVATC